VRRRGTRHLGRIRLLLLGLLFPLGGAASDVLTGTVGAPGGMLAVERSFFGTAHAHVPGLEAVAGATVELIDGGQVLASGKTNARGVYNFPAPAGFQPSPRYLVRARSGGHRLQAFVTALRTNIDPATDATVSLLAKHSRVRTADVQELLPLIQHLAWEVDLPAAHSGAALAAMMREAASNDEEIFNIAASMGAAAEIHGVVTDEGKAPLARITILVRDPASGVTRAMGRTDERGAYRVRVAPGKYAVSAVNETAGSMAASQLNASATDGAERNFRLGTGGRVSGLVTSQNGARLTNVRVKLLQKGIPQVEARTQDDGSYRFNVAPGSYVLLAVNTTLQPFASNVPGTPVEIKSGAEVAAELRLADGQMFSGKASPGTAVRIVDAEVRQSVHVLRTNRAGEYRIWLKPGRYAVQ
jgi:hypothetical protein